MTTTTTTTTSTSTIRGGIFGRSRFAAAVVDPAPSWDDRGARVIVTVLTGCDVIETPARPVVRAVATLSDDDLRAAMADLGFPEAR